MKVLALNLPNKNPIVRRFICSMNSPDFLLPPLELSYLAAVAERVPGTEVRLIDAIAAGWGAEETAREVRRFDPDLAVTILGYEHCGEDLEAIDRVFDGKGRCRVAAMGHMATVYPEEVFRLSNVHLILRNEPEETFRELLTRGTSFEPSALASIPGLAYRGPGGETVRTPERERIVDLDGLPFPARHLWDIGRYSEPFFDKPFSTIQTARGCPFRCAFCTRTYGRQYVARSVGSVMAELTECVTRYGITNFRFIDDTFPVNKKRTLELCQAIVDARLPIRWVCLSRVDLMDEERLRAMRRAGCRRLYVGLESGSDRILRYYQKGFPSERIRPAVERARSAGLEVVGYFVIGSPQETEEDFQKTLEVARSCPLDLVTCARMAPYPGTQTFVEPSADIEFSLRPFVCRYRDADYETRAEKKVRAFYRAVYFDPAFLLRSIRWFMRYPRQSLSAARVFLGYLFGSFRSRERDELI